LKFAHDGFGEPPPGSGVLITSRLDKPFSHKSLRTLRRRGPDEIGFWSDDRVQVGHARLSHEAGTQRLARLVGKGKALELICTGERIGAEEAERIGLIAEAIEDDRLIERSLEAATQIAAWAPTSSWKPRWVTGCPSPGSCTCDPR
jgi:hypothetical protein